MRLIGASTSSKNRKGALADAPATRRDAAALLDLRLTEFDVLLGDRIVLLHDQLLGHGARILLGHVIKAGVGARHELDLDGGGPGHFEPLWRIWPDPTGQAPKVKENGAKLIRSSPRKRGSRATSSDRCIW